ncbi:DUF5789 family protein [Halobaculum sp. D14]|uniref:DUF5789 family protein n=1 Tax=unclassified Halobaculum TaxID=2640896 RepID=UPI003EBFDF02
MRLTGTDADLTDHSYPATSGELIDAYGECRIELQDGAESVGTVLGRLGPDTFESAEEVRDALYGGVSAEAIGRRFYSDRDAPAVGEDGPTQLSF